MKIAIGWFGQARHLDSSRLLSNWERVLSHSNHDIHSFAFLWDTVSNMDLTEDYDSFVNSEKIDDDTDFREFKRISFMRDFQIEKQEEHIDHLIPELFSSPYVKKRVYPENPDSGRATIGQWYSKQRVLESIIATGEHYDYIVLFRPDMQTHGTLRFDDWIITQAHNRQHTTGTICIQDFKIVSGCPDPLANDWYTVIPMNLLKDFATNLYSDMAVMINSLFVGADMPQSIQEAAFYKLLMKRNYQTVSLKVDNISIFRGLTNENITHRWKWPNYKID